jgi:hypothetical protein
MPSADRQREIVNDVRCPMPAIARRNAEPPSVLYDRPTVRVTWLMQPDIGSTCPLRNRELSTPPRHYPNNPPPGADPLALTRELIAQRRSADGCQSKHRSQDSPYAAAVERMRFPHARNAAQCAISSRDRVGCQPGRRGRVLPHGQSQSPHWQPNSPRRTSR